MPTPAELKLMQLSQKLKEAKEKKEAPPSPPPAAPKTEQEFKAGLVTSGILPEAGAEKIAVTLPTKTEPKPAPSKTPEEFKAGLVTSGVLPEAGAEKIAATIPTAPSPPTPTPALTPAPSPEPVPTKTPEEDVDKFLAGLVTSGITPETGAKTIISTLSTKGKPKPTEPIPPETKESIIIDPTQYLETKTISEPVQLTPGQMVRVTWEKNGKTTTVMVKAERLADFEERYNARIIKVETYGGEPITFYQVPTTTEYEEAYRKAYVEEYKKTGEVPQWALEQIEVPEKIKQVGLEEAFIKASYEESIGYKTKAPKGFIGPVALTGIVAFEKLYFSKTMGSKEWVKEHGEFIVAGETKTWKEIKKEQPALYLKYEPGKGYIPELDIKRWSTEYHEEAGWLASGAQKVSLAVTSLFDIDAYSSFLTGGLEKGWQYLREKDYYATLGVQKGEGLKVWAGLQAPAYESVILPLAGGAAFGVMFGTTSKIATGAIKVTGWGAKTVPKIAGVFSKTAPIALAGTYAVGEGVHIGTSFAEDPQAGVSASLKYGTRLGFGLVGYRAGAKWRAKVGIAKGTKGEMVLQKHVTSIGEDPIIKYGKPEAYTMSPTGKPQRIISPISTKGLTFKTAESFMARTDTAPVLSKPAIVSITQTRGIQKITYNVVSNKYSIEKITPAISTKPFDAGFKPPTPKPMTPSDIAFKEISLKIDLAKRIDLVPVQKTIPDFVPKGTFLIEKGFLSITKIYALEKTPMLKGTKPIIPKPITPIQEQPETYKLKPYMVKDITSITEAKIIRHEVIDELMKTTGEHGLEPHVKSAIKRLNELGIPTDQSGFNPYKPTHTFISIRDDVTPEIKVLSKKYDFEIIKPYKRAITFEKYRIQTGGKNLQEIKTRLDKFVEDLSVIKQKQVQEQAANILDRWQGKTYTLKDIVKPLTIQTKLIEKPIPPMKPLITEFQPPVRKVRTLEDIYKDMSKQAKKQYLSPIKTPPKTIQTTFDKLFRPSRPSSKAILYVLKDQPPIKLRYSPYKKDITTYKPAEKPAEKTTTVLLEPTKPLKPTESTTKYEPFRKSLRIKTKADYETEQISNYWKNISPFFAMPVPSISKTDLKTLDIQTSAIKTELGQAQIQPEIQMLDIGILQADITKTEIGTKLGTGIDQINLLATTSITDVATTQAQQQIQLQASMQQLQMVQMPITIQITSPDMTPPYRPKRWWKFPDLPEGIAEKKTAKTQQGYNVYVKDRVYVKGKRKYEDRFKKINIKPLTRENALGLGGTVVDNSAAATFYIKSTTGKTSPPSISISPWAFLQNKFQTKNNKKVEYKTYRMDTQGEIRGISALGWISHQRKIRPAPKLRPRPLPKGKPMKELPELDFLSWEQYSLSMDDFNKVVNRRFNIGI